MELPLIPVILHKIGSMRRHYEASDDYNIRNNDGLERQQQQQRRPQESHDGSQVRQADPPAGLSPSSVAPTMHAAKRRRTADISSTQALSYQRSKSFEERDEERSAFRRPKSRDITEASTASNDRDDEKKIPSKDPEESSDSAMQRPVASMPMSASETTTTSSAQPHLSPMRYYHQRRYAETIRDKPDAPPLQYPYAGGAAHPVPPDPYGYSYPAGYYHPNQYPRPDPPSAHGHPQFPYFQDYRMQQQQQYPSNMMPPAAGYMQHPPYPHDYYAAHGPAHTTYSAKDPPEAIINAPEEEKARRQGTANDPMNLMTTSVGEEDERKPPARSSSRLQESSSRGIEKKSASSHNEMQDIYAPLPFSEVRTLLQSSMKTPSPPSPSTRYAASMSSNLDPFANTLDARGSAQMPQHSPVVSTSTKRARGHNPDRTPIRQSYSSSSAASPSRHESSSKRGNSWDRRFNELLEFKQLHGHCDVPQNYEPNTSLGIWVNKQRMEHKNRVEGKSSSLNDRRFERLESIGFRWAKRKGQASWEEKFKELQEYKAEYGNCHVPTKYKDNTALGRWVSTQRSEYKKFCEGDSKSSMNADKIRRLESIGFAWFMVL